MMNCLANIGLNLAALSSVTITRPDITGLIKPLHFLLVIAIVQYLVGLIAFKIYRKKKRKNKKIVSIVSMLSGIFAEIVFFLSGSTNVILLFILATMKGSANPTDYFIFIGLIYFFSALASLGSLSLMKTSFLKKRGKKKKQSVTFDNYLVSVSLVSGITYLLVYLLFPASFSSLAFLYIVTSLFVTLIGLLIHRRQFLKTKQASKKKKRKPKKRNNKKRNTKHRKRQNHKKINKK